MAAAVAEAREQDGIDQLPVASVALMPLSGSSLRLNRVELNENNDHYPNLQPIIDD
jgi:hypothetical protein